jgi:hypothetical protein
VSGALGVARHEVRERRFLLQAAGSLGLLLVLMLAVSPRGPLPGSGVRGFWETLALFLFLVFPPSVALGVGSSLIGRDLAEGRLPFYFSRPLSAGALWAGKFVGGAVLVLGTFLCCYLPLELAAGGIARQGLVFWVLVLLTLMSLAHVIGAMYRSGSQTGRVALDLGLGALLITLLGAEVRRLVLAAGAGTVIETPLLVALALATLVMMGAAAAQLAYGRADARRGHTALSATFWSCAFLGLVVLALWCRWLLGVTPAQVGGVGYPFFASSRGSALLFKAGSWHGRAGYSPMFLMNGESGAYVRLESEHVSQPAFAADGATAVWVEPPVPWWWYSHEHAWEPTAARGGYVSDTLRVARLGDSVPVVEEQRVEPGESWSMALAVDSERALLSTASSVALVDLRTGRVISRAPGREPVAADLLPDGSVRLYEIEPGTRGALVIVDWNPEDGARVERARTSASDRPLLLARRGELAVVSTGTRSKAILDVATGMARPFTSATPDSPGAGLVLSTGQVALSLGEEVRIVTRDGETIASIPVEAGARVAALREPAPGELAVGLWAPALARRRTVFADASTGAVRREEKDLLPAGPRFGLPLAPEPGSLASRLFADVEGTLLALEPDGRRRVIVAAQAPGSRAAR